MYTRGFRGGKPACRGRGIFGRYRRPGSSIERHCPGLPRSGYGRAEPRRQRRLRMGFHGQRYRWHALEFRRDVALSQRRVRPRLRVSVALPLGINGAACSRWARGWSYPNGLDLGGWGQRGRNEHHDVAALWVARVTPHPLTNNSSPPPAESATSSVKLQPSACRGGRLRGSKSRRNSAHFWA